MKYIKNFEELKDILEFKKRCYGLNFRNVDFHEANKKAYNTIEFRFPNATNEEVIWQNNINVFVNLLLASTNSNIDEDHLDYLLNEREKFSYSYNSDAQQEYKNVNLKEAIEFADLIFPRTIDKIYFLKQYLKNFQTTNKRELVLAKRFIK